MSLLRLAQRRHVAAGVRIFEAGLAAVILNGKPQDIALLRWGHFGHGRRPVWAAVDRPRARRRNPKHVVRIAGHNIIARHGAQAIPARRKHVFLRIHLEGGEIGVRAETEHCSVVGGVHRGACRHLTQQWIVHAVREPRNDVGPKKGELHPGVDVWIFLPVSRVEAAIFCAGKPVHLIPFAVRKLRRADFRRTVRCVDNVHPVDVRLRDERQLFLRTGRPDGEDNSAYQQHQGSEAPPTSDGHDFGPL